MATVKVFGRKARHVAGRDPSSFASVYFQGEQRIMSTGTLRTLLDRLSTGTPQQFTTDESDLLRYYEVKLAEDGGLIRATEPVRHAGDFIAA